MDEWTNLAQYDLTGESRRVGALDALRARHCREEVGGMAGDRGRICVLVSWWVQVDIDACVRTP